MFISREKYEADIATAKADAKKEFENQIAAAEKANETIDALNELFEAKEGEELDLVQSVKEVIDENASVNSELTEIKSKLGERAGGKSIEVERKEDEGTELSQEEKMANEIQGVYSEAKELFGSLPETI